MPINLNTPRWNGSTMSGAGVGGEALPCAFTLGGETLTYSAEPITDE